jgi:lipoate-protein ligase A
VPALAKRSIEETGIIKQEYLRSKGVEDVRQRVATLEQLGRPCAIAQAKAALVEGFSRSLDVSFASGQLSEAEMDLAARLCEEKYRRPEWNLKAPVHRAGKGHIA